MALAESERATFRAVEPAPDREPAGTPIFVLGSPRSGTTWLGKIFDSHPDVRYIHEPEITFPPDDIPVFTPDGQPYAAAMAPFVQRWTGNWHPRSRATVPVFPKSYTRFDPLRPPLIHAARIFYHGIDRYLHAQWLWPVISEPSVGVPVVKGVNLLGRVPTLLAACPEARIIHVVRHPCAQVASVLRGRRRRSARPVPVSALPSSRCGRERGLTAETLAPCDDIARAAWQWLCFNEDVLCLEDPRILTVAYDRVVESPVKSVQEMLTFAGLTPCAEVDAFIARLRSGGHRDSRYSLARDPAAALDRWRRELSAEAQARIEAIAAGSRAGSWFEL